MDGEEDKVTIRTLQKLHSVTNWWSYLHQWRLYTTRPLFRRPFYSTIFLSHRISMVNFLAAGKEFHFLSRPSKGLALRPLAFPPKRSEMQFFTSNNPIAVNRFQPDYTLWVADKPGRRQLLACGAIIPWISLVDPNCVSFAAETKKGFLPVSDQKDGYQFVYPFGWQEIVIEGQDKVFKDVIEPLESVSVNVIPTNKQDIRDFGPPKEVAETLIKKVLAPPTQKTKLIDATERDVDGKAYYTFEFIAQAPNYTRHALSTISIANGKFYTLTTGANERRWEKMKDKLHTVVDSFTVSKV